MTGHWRLLAVLIWGGAASAAPVPPPPQGYAGAQYIDGQGCVFRREGTLWTSRTDGQGQPVCGFPPSTDVRRTDPDSDRALPLTQAPPPDMETLLMDQLSRDLRPGDWTSDPQQPEIRSQPLPARAPDPIQTALQDALRASPAIREATGLSGTSALCARLGYRTEDGASAQGSTLGICPGMQSDVAVTGLTEGERHRAAPPPAAAAPQTPRPAAVAPTTRIRPAGTVPRAPAAAAPASPLRQAAAGPAQAPEMIPASARYVQVGAFADGENALIVLRALAGRGYPTGQTRSTDGTQPMRVIMAGPFADRQSLIAALNDLRRNGYPGAVAR